MAYITNYSGDEVKANLQKSDFISNAGKVPKCFESNSSVTCDNATQVTTVNFAENVSTCTSATTCTNATNAQNCNAYLPLTGGIVNGAITTNKNYIRKNYLTEANHSGSNGDITISSAMSFNTINCNEGSAWNSSNSRFVCPVRGIYLTVFTIYSNNTGNMNVRPALLKNGNRYCFSDGPYGHSISAAVYCEAGDYLQAGAYSTNFPFTTWSGAGHNNFYVTLLQQLP